MLAGRSAILPQRGAPTAAALPGSRPLPAPLTAHTLSRGDASVNNLRRADFIVQVAACLFALCLTKVNTSSATTVV